MDRRVTAVTPGSDRPPRSRRPGSAWTGAFLVAAGIAFGFLLGQGVRSSAPAADTGSGDAVSSPTAEPAQLSAPEPTAEITRSESPPPPVKEAVAAAGVTLTSVEFGRGLVTWPTSGDPFKIRLTSDVWAAAYDAVQNRVAVTLRGNAGGGLALHVGDIGELQLVTTGVTSFLWHPKDPSAIAWVEETKDGFILMEATLSDGLVIAAPIAAVANRVRLVAWGTWGFALQGDHGLTTLAPSGAPVAHDKVQFVAAGSDGRLVVARPAGVPLSSDWAITGPDLANQQALGGLGEQEDRPTAAAILPTSGRIVIVSNLFGDGSDQTRIEIRDADGTAQAVIQSSMFTESIAWSPDEARLAFGGYHYLSNQLRSVVLLVSSDGSGEAIEVPFDHQNRPLGIS